MIYGIVPARGRWRGVGAALDVTNPAAVKWYSGHLQRFRKEFGVDSFKFDAGEVSYLPPRLKTAEPLHNLNRYTMLYIIMAASFGRMIEVTRFEPIIRVGK